MMRFVLGVKSTGPADVLDVRFWVSQLGRWQSLYRVWEDQQREYSGIGPGKSLSWGVVKCL